MIHLLSGTLFYLMTIVVVVYGVMFVYHWNQYGTDKMVVKRTTIIFTSVATVLLLVMFILQSYVA